MKTHYHFCIKIGYVSGRIERHSGYLCWKYDEFSNETYSEMLGYLREMYVSKDNGEVSLFLVENLSRLT